MYEDTKRHRGGVTNEKENEEDNIDLSGDDVHGKEVIDGRVDDEKEEDVLSITPS